MCSKQKLIYKLGHYLEQILFMFLVQKFLELAVNQWSSHLKLYNKFLDHYQCQ